MMNRPQLWLVRPSTQRWGVCLLALLLPILMLQIRVQLLYPDQCPGHRLFPAAPGL